MAGPHKPFLLDYPLDIIEDVGLLYDTQYSTVSECSFLPSFLSALRTKGTKQAHMFVFSNNPKRGPSGSHRKINISHVSHCRVDDFFFG